MVVDIDFEIFSELDVTKVGLHNYFNHPSTDIICMAYKFEGQITKLWRPGRKLPKFPARWTLRAHNVAFERLCLETIGPKYGMSLPETLVCTAAQAAVMSYPRSLEGASKALRLPLLKDKEGRGKMLQVTKPRRPSANNPDVNWFNDKGKMNSTYRYCINDVDVEDMIGRRTYPLSTYERSLFELDMVINKRGVYFDRDLTESAICISDQAMSAADNQMALMTRFKVKGVTKVPTLTKYVNSLGVETPEGLGKDILPILLAAELPQKARSILTLRQMMGKSSVAKYETILRWGGEDNRLRNLFMHHGASTGRWTGKGPQLHNLPQGSKFDVSKAELIELIKTRELKYLEEAEIPAMNALSSCIRETMTASPGNVLGASDFKSIEVRVLAWIAEEMRLLKLLRDGGDPYIDMASDIYKVDVDAVTPEQRNIGKFAVLGLGFQMGWNKFQAQCLGRGVTITDDFAKEVVKIYRQKYRHVCNFWKGLEGIFRDSVQNPREKFTYKGIGMKMRGPHLIIRLPNGRLLYYIEPRLGKMRFGKPSITHMTVDSKTKQWIRRDTYGGMLTENVVQAIARDLLGEAMLRVEAHDYPIVLHVHDELVVDKNWDSFDTDEFEQLMRVVPPWAEGIPIEIDNWYQERYQKG